jgi:hypothetical protein
MKFYELDTEFTFGKYEGKTLKDIINDDQSYIDWCINNLEHFYISNDVIEKLKLIKPDFSISEETQNHLNEKYETWENEQDEDYEEDDYYERDDRDYERDNFDALTDGQYGSYDDFIDNGGDMDNLNDALGY